ncbi:hypothetical protein QMP26_06230 [Enterocloster clostridioformis]|uniref:nucleotidyltransferase domain-containing protein n=1 Tax=Enterocloster clostridioformis TaxID=1531 RepID=UPI002675ADEA|nr:hypothetical protein [Enterocloster clostridioformis]
MIKIETVTKADLLKVLDLMETSGIRYWLDGGWGVDVLLGKQTREHRDVDIKYEFEADYFGSAVFEGRTIPCISAKGQKIFHTGYEFREVDKHDIRIIDYLLSAQSSDRDETGGAVCRAKK